MNLNAKLILACSLAVLTISTAARGSIVVDPGDYMGSRTTVGTTGMGGGLVWNPAAGAWSDGNFSIAWEITNNGSDFTYNYTFTTPLDGSAALSHWILQLSLNDANGDPLQEHWESVFPDGEVKTHTESQGNPDLAADVYGVKLGKEPMISFTTPQVPVWGDFYAKDGGGTGADSIHAFNAGLGTDPVAGGPFLNWIPRPDGARDNSVVPEASSFAVWGLLGISLIAARRRLR